MKDNEMPKGGINITCPICCRTFAFNDSNIPAGAKYEIWCPFCGAKLIRKKISLQELAEKKQKIVAETGRKTAVRNDKKNEN